MNIKEQSKEIQMTGKLYLLIIVSRIALLSGGDMLVLKPPGGANLQSVKQSAFLTRTLEV